MSVTPAQLAILRSRYPGIGDPTLRRNAAALLTNAMVQDGIGDPTVGAGFMAEQPAKKRIRQQSGDGMNKLERAFLAYLQNTYPGDTHVPQGVSLRLANGATFRPDFVSVRVVMDATAAEGVAVRINAWETKGFKREASAVRIKVAARLFPFIAFRLVTKRKKRDGGGWAIEDVLP